jgi:hypothetical protein
MSKQKTLLFEEDISSRIVMVYSSISSFGDKLKHRNNETVNVYNS